MENTTCRSHSIVLGQTLRDFFSVSMSSATVKSLSSSICASMTTLLQVPYSSTAFRFSALNRSLWLHRLQKTDREAQRNRCSGWAYARDRSTASNRWRCRSTQTGWMRIRGSWSQEILFGNRLLSIAARTWLSLKPIRVERLVPHRANPSPQGMGPNPDRTDGSADSQPSGSIMTAMSLDELLAFMLPVTHQFYLARAATSATSSSIWEISESISSNGTYLASS